MLDLLGTSDRGRSVGKPALKSEGLSVGGEGMDIGSAGAIGIGLIVVGLMDGNDVGGFRTGIGAVGKADAVFGEVVGSKDVSSTCVISNSLEDAFISLADDAATATRNRGPAQYTK
jgi:hypothetical protein